MQPEFVIDATGRNPVLGPYRIVDQRERSNAYDVWSEYLCVSKSNTPMLSTCVFEALAEPPEAWFDEDGEPLPERLLNDTLFPPAYFEGRPVSRIESFVCGPLIVSPDGDTAPFDHLKQSEIADALNTLGWPFGQFLVSRVEETVVSKDASQLSVELVSAYLATRYAVDADHRSFELVVGERCDALVPYVDGEDRGAVFVTAWNPSGENLGAEENCHRNSLLKADLESITQTVLGGRGVGSSEDWQPEESFIAFDVAFEQAIHIGRHYAQNAIVWVGQDYVPKLVLLR